MLLDLSPRNLSERVDELSSGEFLRDPIAELRSALDLLQPPERISSLECAEKFRWLPGKEAGAKVRYDRWRTPYNIGPHNALDNPKCKLLVMVKPSRSGGTTIAENYLFKLCLFGPMTHITWVLNSDDSVTAYCKQVVKPMFELNDDLQARVGKARGDDTDAYKLVSGYPVEWLSAKDSTFRNREPGFMVSDETDAWAKKYAATPKVQIDGRQKQLGHRRKAAIMSHPDLGWASGSAASYEDSTRGIFVMTCPECLGHAAAYATKFWDSVPEFKLTWQRNEQLGNDERIALAERTAALVCPHCGAALDEEQRHAMIDAAVLRNDASLDGWMHRGQVLDQDAGVIGEPEDHETFGFWVHGTALKTESCQKLARDYEAALIKFERTRNPAVLREFLSKQMCEVYEGAATTGGLSARTLKARVGEAEYDRGLVPPGVDFITAAIDPGRRQMDVLFTGWDRLGNSWLIDRLTLRQRQHEDGIWRDIDLYGRIEDWDLVLRQVVDRKFAMAEDPELALPVAVTCLDASDGHVTWKAREFARRALRSGYAWGNWSKIKLIKGAAGKRPMLPPAPRREDKDELGKTVEPFVLEYTLGVDALKEMTLERLATAPETAGHVRFYREFESHYIDQFFGESLVDGKWHRFGPNESLDLYGYCEAGRLMLAPDRKDIIWTDPQRRPPWARPISLLPKGGDQAVEARGEQPLPAAKPSLLDQFSNLNRPTR